MPLHKIAELQRSTNNNIEQQAREYVDDCLYGWFACWEQAIFRDLLLPEEQKTYFAKFNPDALLRGDTLSRVRANIMECGGPYHTRDEVRDREDLNRIGGPMSQVITPLNVTAGDGAPSPEEMEERVAQLERDRASQAA
jgi:phage portal protein BeeE